MTGVSPRPGLDLDALSRRFRRALMAYFQRRVGDAAEAQDLTQEVFVRIANAEPREFKSAESYIFQIAANLLRDRGRTLAFRRKQTDAIAAAERRRGEPPDAERILIGKDNLETIIAALNDLPTKTRDIFLLNRLEGLNRLELAEMFGLTPRTVTYHLEKASAALAARLQDQT